MKWLLTGVVAVTLILATKFRPTPDLYLDYDEWRRYQ